MNTTSDADTKLDDRGVIFVIGEVGLSTPVNIGYASSARTAEKRLQELSWASHRPLELLEVIPYDHARWVEYQLQVALAPWRIQHLQLTEWFHLCSLTTSDWQTFVSDALAGRVTGSAELPGRSGNDEHQLLHVQGRPRQLRAMCSCGWTSQEGSATGACVKFDRHVAAQSGTPFGRRSA